ncbi:unnamed protein product [Gordionus sp. m RMFG-2023]
MPNEDLFTFSGSIMGGLAGPEIVLEKELAVVCGPTNNIITDDVNIAISHAIADIFHNNLGTSKEQERKILIGSAVVCFRAGLICTKRNGTRILSDGNWRKIPYSMYGSTILTVEQQIEVSNATLKSNLLLCATLIAATKINWYKQNSHIGQVSSYSNYMKRVVLQKFDLATSYILIRVIKRVGSWASTRAVLTQFGLANVCQPTPVIAVNIDHSLWMDADVKGINSNPAGTARHFIALQIVKHMLNSITIALCPDISDFSYLPYICSIINKNPAVYHIDAEYLCEGTKALAEKIEFSDMQAATYLGRVGTYWNAFMRNGTLQSPHLSSRNYHDAEDFCIDYEIALKRFKITGATATLPTVNIGRLQPQLDAYKSLAKAFGVTPNPEVIVAMSQL